MAMIEKKPNKNRMQTICEAYEGGRYLMRILSESQNGVLPMPSNTMERIAQTYAPFKKLGDIHEQEGYIVANYLKDRGYTKITRSLVNLSTYSSLGVPFPAVYHALVNDERLPVHLAAEGAVIGPAELDGQVLTNGVAIWIPPTDNLDFRSR